MSRDRWPATTSTSRSRTSRYAATSLQTAAFALSSTGAAVVPPEGFGDFLNRLLSEGLAAELLKHTTITLWDGWPLLLVFTLLMSTEWYLRKKRGLV